MMTIENVTRYVIKNYPYPDELSKARLNKIVYLIDWKNVLEHNEQITNIHWKFNYYGPYVDDIENCLRMDKRFDIENTINFYSGEKNVIKLSSDIGFAEPNQEDKKIIDFIIEKTKQLFWKDFIDLVYSTYPIISQEKGSFLNLVELAKEYKLILHNREKKQ